MSTSTPFSRDVFASLLLLALLAVVLWRFPVTGVGPLGWLTAVACVHAALFVPSLCHQSPALSLLPLLLVVPLLVGAGYGHATGRALDAVVLVAAAALAGCAGRMQPAPGVYLATVLAWMLLPFACGYLVLEFGDAAAAPGWRRLSPLAAAFDLDEGRAVAPGAWAGLLVWPLAALAGRGRR